MMRAPFLAVLSALAVLWGCGERNHSQPLSTTETRATAMTTEVTIKLGEMGPSLAKRYPSNVKVQHQPAGLDFYEIDWDQQSPGTVRVEHRNHSFVVEHVLGVLSSQDLEDFKSEGLKEFNISSGITEPDRIPHDEARLKTYAILKRIMDAGWKNTVDIGDPRVRGKDRLRYALLQNKYVGLDVTYVPTLEEWMQIESRTPWNFYANGLYMNVIFTRERSLTDREKPGSYLLTFNIRTDTEYFRGFAGPDNRLRWKELLPQEIAKAAASRAQKEAELRAKGVSLDESYQDPPAPAQ